VAIGAACAALFSLPIMHEKTDQHPMPNAKSEAVYRGVPLPLIAGLQTTQVTGNFRARCTRSPKFEAPSWTSLLGEGKEGFGWLIGGI